ncbi:divergent polysaccharide deacteylase family protein [Aliiroseovarius sp.]|uniref:divergent polysaccharide deacteylase family protein n=1 Tax=Aliiroseovarius sp. TaxID=1872442 RepID=UPI00262C6CF1|nr:divergent polysaccharide deacteylase family protein [Aliiroseovarius sp.]
MARGIFAGIVSGAVVGGLGLATLSVVNGPVDLPKPGGDEIAEAPITTPEREAAGEPAAVDIAAAPAETAPEPTPEPAPDAEPDPLPQPAADAERVPTPAPAPVPAPAPAPAPAQPETSDAQPDADQAAGEAIDPAPEPDSRPTGVEGESETSRPDQAPAAPGTGAPQTAPAAGEAAPSPTPLPQTEAALDPALSAGTAPESESGASLPAAEGAGPPAVTPSTLEEPDQPPAAPESSEPPASARVKSDPLAPIGNLAPNVTTDRLPTIGDDEAEAGQPPAVAAISPLAIERNAVAFDRPAGLPMMAVMLVDDPETRAGLGDLANLPFPVSFIVTAEQPDAAEAIAFYRGAGAEVLISITLPEGAKPVDAEVTLQGYSGFLADAVGLQVDESFQASGTTAAQVAQVLVEGGHGLVSQPQGLNTGHKSALKAGVPAGLVFRELDNDGQTAAVIRRFLDNAAFKARQERGVILRGHARPETLKALIEWSLGNRVKSVAMAPVSAVLLDG